MGNQQFSNSLSQCWQQLNYNHLPFPGSPLLLKSKQNKHLLAEKYTFDIAPDQLFIPIYRLRKQKSKRLVSVLHFEQNQKCWGCDSNNHSVSVLTEHLPIRLSNLSILHLSQTAYLLAQTLKAYKQIANFKLLCYPQADMIGIKENGIVKVWINSNWSLNSCKKAKNEMSAVEEIIMLVSGFCKDPQVKLLQDIRQIPNINFETAIKCIQNKFMNIFNEGRLLLQKRIVPQTNKNHYHQSHIRPRAYSQGNKKSIANHIHHHNYPEAKVHTVNTQGHPQSFQHQNNRIKKPLSCNYNGKDYQNQINHQQNLKFSETHFRVQENKNKIITYEGKKNVQPKIKKEQIHFQNVLLNKPFVKAMPKNIGSTPIHMNTKKFLNFIYTNPQKNQTLSNSTITNTPGNRIFQSNQAYKNKIVPEPISSIKKFDYTQASDLKKSQEFETIDEAIEKKKEEDRVEVISKAMAEQFKYYLRSASKAEKCDLTISVISEEPDSRDYEFQSEKQKSHRNSVSKQTVIH